jgi:hypothetical protein
MRTPLATALLAGALFLLTALSSVAEGEVAQKQGVRVSVQGTLAPKALPRSASAPVSVSFSGKIGSTSPQAPPQLEAIAIAINSHGRLLTAGLPRCRLGHISPSTSQEALAACRSSLVGEGRFSADVKLPEQSPFPSAGKVLAFNGRYQGRPAILAHIYGTEPVPTSYVLPFTIRATKGTYGTVLEASLPRVTGEWGFVTGISMVLDRSFTSHGEKRSYVSADCPAPKGFPGVVFPLAKTVFSFEGGPKLSSVLNRSCRVAGR